MAEAGDFLPDYVIGLMSEGIDVSMPSSDLRDDQWMDSSQPSPNVQVPLVEDDIRQRDSVSHHSTSAKKSSQRSSSRFSVKIKEAKVKRAVAEL